MEDYKRGAACCCPQPAAACVANQTDLSVYDPLAGIPRGTIFAYLDLPWGNEINHAPLPNTLRNQLMAVGFALHEAILYLDTHPDDSAMHDYATALKKQSDMLSAEYEKQWGPLTAAANPGAAWTADPWPWQMAFNERRS